MAGSDLTAISAILKEVYEGPIREQMQKATILMSAIQKKTATLDASGKYAVVPLMTQFSEGVGARGDNDDLPQYGSVTLTNAQVPVKSNYGRIYVTGKAIRQSKTQTGAFLQNLDLEIKQMVNGLKRDINRQLFGDGTGALATVTAIASSGSAVDIYVDSVQYLKKGMFIDIYDGSALKTPATYATITAVDSTNLKITIDTLSANTTVTCKVYRNGSKNNEIYGLGNIVNTTSWLVDPATYPVWQAQVEALSGSYSNTDLLNTMQALWSDIELEGEEIPDVIVTSGGKGITNPRDLYTQALTQIKKIEPATENKFGFTGPVFNGVPVIVDPQCTNAVMYMLTSKHLAEQKGAEYEWGQVDGNILYKVASKDAYTGFMYTDHQFVTTKRNAQGKLTGW